MADKSEILIKLSEEDWTQARHAEDERTSFTNIIIVITSAILGLISQSGLSINALPLTFFLVVLGLYGALSSQKLYERHRHFGDRMRLWRNKLADLNPDLEIKETLKAADIAHTAKFRRIEKIRLYYLWLVLHFTIALVGIILSLIIIF
jgi:hypothetical protein